MIDARRFLRDHPPTAVEAGESSHGNVDVRPLDNGGGIDDDRGAVIGSSGDNGSSDDNDGTEGITTSRHRNPASSHSGAGARCGATASAAGDTAARLSIHSHTGDAAAVGKAQRRSRWSAGRSRLWGSHAQGSEIENPRDLDACREAALRLLDAAPRSSGELSGRLVAQGYESETVDDVILRLTNVGLIDDEAYAWMALRHCVSRMYGRRGTVAELKRKGVDRELAERVARQADEQGLFEEAAWELGRSVAGKTAGLDVQVRKRRFWSAGGRKGHNPETLQAIAHELFG